ncbi:hypothetical protein TNCV_426561 [Trichonephila clavipes]|nr:hypothetical protein TNCV_426561 [Trichonephila clavipes]
MADMIKPIRRITIDKVVEELGFGHERAQKMQSPKFFLEGFLKLIKRHDKWPNVLAWGKIKLCLIFNISFYVLIFIHNSDHSWQGKLPLSDLPSYFDPSYTIVAP